MRNDITCQWFVIEVTLLLRRVSNLRTVGKLADGASVPFQLKLSGKFKLTKVFFAFLRAPKKRLVFLLYRQHIEWKLT